MMLEQHNLLKPCRLVSLLVLALGACATSGCSESQSSGQGGRAAGKTIRITRVTTQLEAIDGDGKRLELDVSLDKLVRDRLGKSKSLILAEPEKSKSGRRRGAKLRLAARLLPDGFTGRLHALVSARVSRTGSIPLTADLDAEGAAPPDGGSLTKAQYTAHLEKALGDALTAIEQQAKLLSSGSSTLIKALDHDEADVRMAAIRTLGERRERDAVEPLCDLLSRERNQVGQAAVGALATIGDRRGAPCLIQWAGSDDRRLLLIIDPLSTLGGDEAEAFIEMIASGHDDARIQRVAEEGLRRMGVSSGTKSKSSGPSKR